MPGDHTDWIHAASLQSLRMWVSGTHDPMEDPPNEFGDSMLSTECEDG